MAKDPTTTGGETPVAVGRVRRRQDFLAANRGVRVPLPPFVLLVNVGGHGMMRVGFTVSRKVGNAVRRNRVRRRLRAAARQLLPLQGIAGADHIFIARPMTTEPPFSELLAHVEKGLKKARQRLGEQS